MYSNNEKTYIWLTLAGVSPKKQLKLLEFFEEPELLVVNWKTERDLIEKVLTKTDLEKLNKTNKTDLEKLLTICEKEQIQIVTQASPHFPESLRHIDDAPTTLFCMGNVHLLKSEAVAIVGTRRMTKYGAEVTDLFAKQLAMAGLTIVSGLGDGVDSKAHKATLDVNGKTIAVLGSGFHHIYPATNVALAKSIVDKGGLLVSEYVPDEKAKVYYFPTRNRIIAGLSKGVLITEATLNSGSMHTKRYALDYGRNLYIVPARITDMYSVGCNQTIKDLQGSMVLSPEDILEDYHLAKANTTEQVVQLSLDESNMMTILGADELHYEELQQKSGMKAKELSTLLLRMEMRGLITKLPGNYYRK